MRFEHLFAAILTFGPLALPGQAQLTSPLVGSRAEINGTGHNVGGSVTIVDDDTLRFDEFTYDGGGLDVRFYLGAEDTYASFVAGIAVGPQLLGMVFDGTQDSFTIDMPSGQTLEGWHAISVWCVDVPVSFGSGAFVAPSFPDGDFNRDGVVDAADYTTWRDALGTDYDVLDYDTWKGNFGATALGAGSALTATNVPEPGGSMCLMAAMTIAAVGRRRTRHPRSSHRPESPPARWGF